jgi:disintegrin and metalloproteinase domain-containing protein 10
MQQRCSSMARITSPYLSAIKRPRICAALPKPACVTQARAGFTHPQHDPLTCQGAEGGNYIMYSKSTDASKPNNNIFSNCSITEMKRVLRTKATCFTKYTGGSVCGNLVVEDGVRSLPLERCTALAPGYSYRLSLRLGCGFTKNAAGSLLRGMHAAVHALKSPALLQLQEECDSDASDACCTAQCKLAAGAACSPNAHSCCTAECKIAPPTTSCRKESMRQTGCPQ